MIKQLGGDLMGNKYSDIDKAIFTIDKLLDKREAVAAQLDELDFEIDENWQLVLGEFNVGTNVVEKINAVNKYVESKRPGLIERLKNNIGNPSINRLLEQLRKMA
jgi:hypothetical protein